MRDGRKRWKSCELESWNVEQAEELQTDTSSGFYPSSASPRGRDRSIPVTHQKSEKSKHRPMGSQEGGRRSICSSGILLREVRCMGRHRMKSGADDVGRERRSWTDRRTGNVSRFRRVDFTEACHHVPWKRPEKRENPGTARIVPDPKHPCASMHFRQPLRFRRGGQQTMGEV